MTQQNSQSNVGSSGGTAESRAQARFPNVSCSQCGGEFGPGNEGFSSCCDHGNCQVVARGDKCECPRNPEVAKRQKLIEDAITKATGTYRLQNAYDYEDVWACCEAVLAARAASA